MKITVVCFGRMREHLPEGHRGNRADIDVPENSTVADVTGVLGAPPEEVFAILIDGVQAKMGEKVSEGSEVTLMPPFTGGAT